MNQVFQKGLHWLGFAKQSVRLLPIFQHAGRSVQMSVQNNTLKHLFLGEPDEEFTTVSFKLQLTDARPLNRRQS